MMIRLRFLMVFFMFASSFLVAQPSIKAILVIHGGAGAMNKSLMTPEKEAAYLAGLRTALSIGYQVLKNNGSSLDAITQVVKTLEDNPLFNAGKGAVLTHDRAVELDAAIMDGKNRAAGSVAGLRTTKNPITAARAVMEKSPHVMLSGAGADQFSAINGCEQVPNSYFFTEERIKSLQEELVKDSLEKADKKGTGLLSDPAESLRLKMGTVGAVALDAAGNLAAATSTGGMTNKKWGRIGDAPIIGIGTYADNNSCAVSCTGWGEYFIRAVVAKTIADQVKYGKISLEDAAKNSLAEVAEMGGSGGLIALDRAGNFTMPFNTAGMFRGFVDADGNITVAIY